MVKVEFVIPVTSDVRVKSRLSVLDIKATRRDADEASDWLSGPEYVAAKLLLVDPSSKLAYDGLV